MGKLSLMMNYHFLYQYTYVDKQEKINLFNKDYFSNYQKSFLMRGTLKDV